MTYDLVLWRRRKGASLSSGALYLCVSEGLDCEDELALLPRSRIAQALVKVFGKELPCELDACERHLQLTVPSEQTGAWLLSMLDQFAAAEGLVIYDPQTHPPTATDERVARSRTAAVREPTAADHLRDAESGNVIAMNNVGVCYASGEGVTRDPERAVFWYRKAADAGCLPALVNLAECYRNGEGVVKDVAEAIRLYERAIPEDPCVSAFELGQIYAEGEAGQASLERAERFFLLARANGHPEAYVALKRIGRRPPD